MFLEAARASEVSTGSRCSPISDPEITTQEGSGGGCVYGGQKSEISSTFFYVRKWSQKASRIIYTTFFAEIRPSSPRFEPFWWHVWWNSAVIWVHHVQKTAFFSQIRFHVRCDVNIVFLHRVRYIFGIIPYVTSVFGSSPSLWGVDWLEIQPNFRPRNYHTRRVVWRVCVWASKKWNVFEKFLCQEMIPKGCTRHLHHFFRRNSTNFTPIWPFWWLVW